MSPLNRIAALFLTLVATGAWAVNLSVPEKPLSLPEWKQFHSYALRRFPLPPPAGNIQRLTMVDDLVRSHLRLGMSRGAARALLGESDTVDGTVENSIVDEYWLVERPAQPQLWQLNVWLRYRTSEPVLNLEYGVNDGRLIHIFID